MPCTHTGLPCVPIHMHILLSPDGHVMRAVHMHMQILHRLCKFRKFAQSRRRLCIFFSICTGFFIRWTCVFHDMCKFSICTATDGDGLKQLTKNNESDSVLFSSEEFMELEFKFWLCFCEHEYLKLAVYLKH